MKYTIRQIAKITGGDLLQPEAGDHLVEHLLIDSRRVFFPETSLFLPFAGAKHDGHDFIAPLYRQGVRNFLISRQIDCSAFPGAAFILVDDVVTALQALAKYHRQQFDLPVIGITGSNGKTIVKEWLFQLLHEDYYIVRSPKSYNSQIGVPLSVWQIRPEHELAIFEAGLSTTGEMSRSAPVVDCRIGILTNIGEAHSEGFPSREEKLRQKLQLFHHAEVLIYCRDNPMIDEAVRRLGIPVFCWSKEKEADLRITGIEHRNGQTLIGARFREKTIRTAIPFIDEASVENAVHCWATLLYLGISPEIIQKRMAHLSPVAMRLELKEGINNCIIINDSYNADLNSLANALDFLDQQKRSGRRTLILSDILQSGMDKRSLYQQVAQLVLKKKIDRLIGIGTSVPILAGFINTSIEQLFFPDTDSFLRAFADQKFANEMILLKGARPFTFERIAQRLAQKAHMTTLEIDLDAMIHNLNTFYSRLRPGVRVMAMVKADAYGTGSIEVAKLLEFHRVSYLAVAYADEGIELRQEGVQLPILVLNPEEAVFEEMLRYRLEPEIYSLSLLRKFAAFAGAYQDKVAIHLKLDTGMHRLGFEAPDIEAMTGLLLENQNLEVRSVFTHLAASESPEHDAFTLRQCQKFDAMYEQIAARLGYRPLRHLLNSNGIVRFPEYQLDMVRLGIGIYGFDASGMLSGHLLPVFQFKAQISQIREVPAGDTIGYGCRAAADTSRKIATITVGYADGVPRAAGNGRFQVLLHDRRAPIVGNVCMDMCMIDVSHIPEAAEGDEVIIFGKDPTVQELAATMNTIPYEIWTRISRRVKRVYVQA